MFPAVVVGIHFHEVASVGTAGVGMPTIRVTEAPDTRPRTFSRPASEK